MRTERLLPFLFFVVVPTLFYYSLTERYWAGLRLDTREATANQIKRGMTLEEAEYLIGGPPGDYRITQGSDLRYGYSGFDHAIWTTDVGCIDVEYGVYQRLVPRDPNLPPRPIRDPQTEPIESVRWYPASRSDYRLLPYALITALVPLICFIIWRAFRLPRSHFTRLPVSLCPPGEAECGALRGP